VSRPRKCKHAWTAVVSESADGWHVAPVCVLCCITGSPEDMTWREAVNRLRALLPPMERAAGSGKAW
jgi:hypothetical protein